MDTEKIKKAKTLYLGKNIIYFESIDSTQDYAKQIAKEKAQKGTVVLAEFQTKGKGTKDRRWVAEKQKNIMMTAIWYPNSHICKLEGLTIQIAEAIQKAVKKLYGYELAIKEPNDLYLNGKKIGGILTQSTTIQNIVTNLYIGIGLNVNEEKFAEEISNIATSLKKEYQREFEREALICKILEEIEKVLEKIEII